MKRGAVPLMAGVMAAGLGLAQDLPPGMLLHARARDHAKAELERLENVSCLETVERQVQPPKGQMRPLDTVRLEVLFNKGKELFASPGGRKFSEQHPITYVGSGLMGTGTFAAYLKTALLSSSVSYEYAGEEEIGGRRVARYNYRLPLMWSGQVIKIPEGSGTVGLHGAYWVDAASYDVVRLDVIAEDIPPTLPITEMTTSIRYAPVRVGNDLVLLLPESAESRITRFSGKVDFNRMEFTHCRVFGAETTVSFGDGTEAEPRFGVSSVDDTLRTLPAGLQIAVKLATRISGDMTVGTLIDGAVAGNVTAKGKVIVAAGSPVLGRVRRLERYTNPFPYFVVGLEFTEVQAEGIRYRFYADPVEIEPVAGIEQKLATKDSYEARVLPRGGRSARQTEESLFLPDLPGVAAFFFKGDTLNLPQGFRTVWKTRVLEP